VVASKSFKKVNAMALWPVGNTVGHDRFQRRGSAWKVLKWEWVILSTGQTLNFTIDWESQH